MKKCEKKSQNELSGVSILTKLKIQCTEYVVDSEYVFRVLTHSIEYFYVKVLEFIKRTT